MARPGPSLRGRRSPRDLPGRDIAPSGFIGDSFYVATWEPIDLGKSLVVIGFPSVGLVGSIGTAHLVKSLNLREAGAVISPAFPPTSVIRDGISTSPVRLYLGDVVCGPEGSCEQLCVVQSDIAPEPRVVASLAYALVSWAKARKARALVCLESLKVEDAPAAEEEEVRVLGLASDTTARDLLGKLGISLLEDGLLTGVGGVVLYEARVRALPALCLLAESRTDFPDARGAARLLEILRPLVPLVQIDEKPLYVTAKALEAALKEQTERSQRAARDLSARADVMFG